VAATRQPDVPLDPAREHFDTAREHYANGRYREAILELEAAVALDPEGAELVYNLGVIYEKLQDIDSAILHYRRYAYMISEPGEQERVTKIIARLEGAREQLAAGNAREQPAMPTESPTGDQPSELPVKKGRVDKWVLGTGALAGVAAIAGGYFGVRALSERNDDAPTTGSGTTYRDLEDRADRAKQHALLADVSFGVALAAGATAAILYFTRDAQAPEAADRPGAARAWVGALPGGAAAGFAMGF
jgi:tetratricopeptide (TPR) repeat protein